MPIVVLGMKPATADETQLQTIASNSGGFYHNVTSIAEVTAAVNRAVQLGFARSADFDSGKASEFLPVSPIVGTVNLEGANDAAGSTLPNTNISAVPGGQHLPQRSNVMITSGFRLPGFDGALRAFRTYKPVPDSTKPTGWKFANDGTRLWPDLDGRPSLAGMARTVADPNTRNIYTFIPNGSGGGSTVAFTTANATLLASHLGVTDPTSLITSIRAQPLGAVIGSTPALMDAPSLDPPPDDDYGFPNSTGTFAGDHKDRRAILFFGANDGMIHGVDARTGYEVWAFIPYNLLPKLKTLLDGQPVEQFDFFVDSSPKIAEVKIGGAWTSLLILGEGSGGTFYQAFDVSEAGMGVSQSADGLSAVSAMLARFDTPDESIAFKWAFPNYSSFDPTYAATFTVTDGTPGGKVKLFGDLKSTANFVEKTVGYTWSDPAVGPLDNTRSTNAVIVGSGYFPDIETLIPARAGGPKAGSALYLLDVSTGKPIGNASGATCATIAAGSGTSTGCAQVADVSNGRKNALQSDPTAAGNIGSFVVNRAYMGDVDGKYRRFAFTSTGVISTNWSYDTGQPIYGSSALLFVGSTDIYAFFATGSDLLPVTTTGGTGTFKLFGLKDNYPSAPSLQFSRNLAPTTNVGGIASGERPSGAPSVAGDIVFYTTIVEDAATPATVSSRLYGVTYAGGAAYDSDGDGKIGKSESPVAATLSGRATAPFIVNQHLLLWDHRNRRGQSRVLRRCTGLQQRHWPGRGAHPVLAGGPVMTMVRCPQCGAKMREEGATCGRCRTQPAAPVPAVAPQAPVPPVASAPSSSTVIATVVGVILLAAGVPFFWSSGNSSRAPVTPRADPFASRRQTSPSAEEAVTNPAPSPTGFMESNTEGGVAYAGGEYGSAAERYEAAIAKNPDDAESLSNLGQVLVRQGKAEEALPYFDRAIAIIPQRWAYRFNRARALGIVGRTADAVAGYRDAQQLFPNDYATAFNLGLALHKLGDEAAAVDAFSKAIELDPNDATFRMALGTSLERLQRPRDAAAAYEEYLRLAPSAPDAAAVRARIAQLTQPPAPVQPGT